MPKQLSLFGNVRQIQVSAVADKAAQIFVGLGYDGSDGRNLWKAAALWSLGQLTGHQVHDSIQGARLLGDDRPRYFYTVLKEHLAKEGRNLQGEFNAVRIIPEWPSSAPVLTRCSASLALAEALTVPLEHSS